MSMVLADAISLGLTKMAGSSPSSTIAKLFLAAAWQSRDESDSVGLTEFFAVAA
jgi:hypothetical protein